MCVKRYIGCGVVVLATTALVYASRPLGRGKNASAERTGSAFVVNDVTASPRVYLGGAPIDGTVRCVCQIGATENNPCADGNLEIPAGPRVDESSKWDHAVGGLAKEDVPTASVKPGTGGSEEVVPCLWVSLADDDARGIRAGPTADPYLTSLMQRRSAQTRMA
jgi:hypothetical protein